MDPRELEALTEVVHATFTVSILLVVSFPVVVFILSKSLRLKKVKVKKKLTSQETGGTDMGKTAGGERAGPLQHWGSESGEALD